MNTNRSIRWLIFGILMFSLSAASFAQIAVGVSVRFGPPAIPVYSQPICPGPGYLWTPGYWAWDDDGGYYWVPGTWVIAPVGMLWTPGYWGWEDGFYRWHVGYWGPHVGFYGGINYGFGYTGVGFYGGEWRGGAFYYNRAVMNVNVTRVRNVYERRVIVHNNSRVSYNGGSGGIHARPTRIEERYSRESHREALADQRQHERAASQNRRLFAAENHGRPAIAATGRAGDFNGRNVIAARQAGAPYRAPRISPQAARPSSREDRGTQQRHVENNRSAAQPANRGAEQRNAVNNRSAARSANREQPSRDAARNNTRQQASPARTDQRRQQQQAKAEQKQQQQTVRQEQKRQQQAQRAERKPAQQAQKRQQPAPRGGSEGRGPGR